MKGHVSYCKRPPIALRKATKRRLKDGKTQFKRYAFVYATDNNKNVFLENSSLVTLPYNNLIYRQI